MKNGDKEEGKKREWAIFWMEVEEKRQTEVNFINILQAAFATIFFCQKITKPNCR